MNRSSSCIYGEQTVTHERTFKLPVANGALLEAPVYESHRRGTNYLAIIDIDGTMPGGLERHFCDSARGECLYLVEKIMLFDALECAADYSTSVGKRKRIRWYGIVLAKTDDYLLLETCESGAKAVLRAKAARISQEDRIRAMKEEQSVLISRTTKLQEEIEYIETNKDEGIEMTVALTGKETVVIHEHKKPE
jgi:hypothetical protein